MIFTSYGKFLSGVLSAFLFILLHGAVLTAAAPAYSGSFGSEAESLVRIEESAPTTALNVAERYLRLKAVVKMMLDEGRPASVVLTRDEAARIDGLIRRGNREEAARMFRSAILKLRDLGPNEPAKMAEPSAVGAPPVAHSTKYISVDAGYGKGIFPDFLFGTLTSPVHSERSYELAREAGFRLLEVKIDIDGVNDSKLVHFERSVRDVFRINAHPLIWLLMNKTKSPDQAALKRDTIRVLKILREIDPAYPYVIRIGNEPDNAGFWRGTKTEMFDTYADIAGTIKNFDGRYAVGGFALMNGCSFSPSEGLDCARLNDWLIDFLEYARARKTPVDFLTVHGYSVIGYRTFYQQFGKVADILSRYPSLSPLWGTPRLGNDEWNIMVGDVWSGSYKKQFDTAWTAASNVISWTAMADNGVWLSVRYGGTGNDLSTAKGDPVKGHDFPMTYADGSKKPVYYAMQAINSLAGRERLKVTGSDYVNFAAIAGRGSDGSIVIVAANFDAERFFSEYPDRHPKKFMTREFKEVLRELGKTSADRFNAFNVSVSGLQWGPGDRVVFEKHIIDGNSDGARLIEKGELGGAGSVSLHVDAHSPAVYVLKIYRK